MKYCKPEAALLNAILGELSKNPAFPPPKVTEAEVKRQLGSPHLPSCTICPDVEDVTALRARDIRQWLGNRKPTSRIGGPALQEILDKVGGDYLLHESIEEESWDER